MNKNNNYPYNSQNPSQQKGPSAWPQGQQPSPWQTGNLYATRSFPKQRQQVPSAREELAKEYEYSRQAARDNAVGISYTPAQRAKAKQAQNAYPFSTSNQQTGSFEVPSYSTGQFPTQNQRCATGHFSTQPSSTGQFTAQRLQTGSIPRIDTPAHGAQTQSAQQDNYRQRYSLKNEATQQSYTARSAAARQTTQAAGTQTSPSEVASALPNAYPGSPNATNGEVPPLTPNGNAGNTDNVYIPAGIVRPNEPRRKGPSPKRVIIGLLVAAVICIGSAFGITTYLNNAPVNVTINGEAYTLEGNQRTLQGLLDEQVINVSPGNYVAVDGSVMKEGQGNRCTAQVNGTETTDLTTRLNEGDQAEITNGSDITEPYTDSDIQEIPFTTERKGTGALHVYTTKGETGEKCVRTGSESGIAVDIVSKEPVTQVVTCYNPQTNGEKVVCLTFDDGPWPNSTNAVLDILKENSAKATFYTIGDQVAGQASVVQRMTAEGHEIATHTYDHAQGSGKGVSLNYMSTQERQNEVTKGLDEINKIEGAHASTAFRAPGGNFDNNTAADLANLVTAEIGWNIDTGDWKRPGADVIAERIKSAKPGNIILMHDGGGDRSQTIEALRVALPYLKEQGYTFITVSELIERYPPKES